MKRQKREKFRSAGESACATSADSRGDERRFDRSFLLKIAGLAIALGVATWLVVPLLIPVRLPGDFPQLPDLRAASPGLRELLGNADREARRRLGSAEAVGKLGIAYHSNEYFEQAAKAYRIAARLAPNDYQWVYCRAYLDQETGNDKQELAELQQTLRLAPQYAPALLKLADSFFKLDQLDEAGHYYEIASRLPQNDASMPAVFGLARIAARRQEWNKVIERITPLLQTHPYLYPPYELLQQAYEALGQPDKAAEAAKNAAAARWKIMPPPDDPLNEQLAAICYSSTRLLKQAGVWSRVGRPDRAIDVARRAAQADPSDAAIPNFLSHTLLTFFGDQPAAIEEAFKQVGECLRLKPDDLTPLWSFADDFFKSPKPAPAVERLASLLSPHAQRAEAHYYLAMVAAEQGRLDEAISQYQAALASNPNDSAVHNKMGQVLQKAGRSDQAIAHLQRSVALNPMNTGARLNLGIALMDRRNYGDAMKQFSELLRNNPHDAETQFCMAYALMYSRRTEEAIQRFREGLQYKPNDAEGHYGLASALYAQRDRNGARAEAREALRLRPNFPPAQELLHQIER